MVKLAPLTPTTVEPVGVSYLQSSLFFEPTANNVDKGTSEVSGTDSANEDRDEDIQFELEEWEETRRPTEGKNKEDHAVQEIQLLQSPRFKRRMAKHRFANQKELPEGDFKVSPRQTWSGRGGYNDFEDPGSVP